MKILDLFSGTGSVEKVALKLGHSVISLDISDKLGTPTIQVDIMKWNYRTFSPGEFDVIFAGVPCQAYSNLQVLNKTPEGRASDIEKSNILVKRTLKIVNYFKPRAWFIENPESGCLKDQAFMKNLPYYRISYCKYGFPYRKNTIIWTNLIGFKAKRCKFDCDQLDESGRRHVNAIGIRSGQAQKRTSRIQEKYSYPPELIEEVLNLASM
jgi:hypothetical protein